MPEETSGLSRIRKEINDKSIAAVIVGWSVLCLVAFATTDLEAMRFLGLPLGVYLAGQGALMVALALGARVARN
ncbi:MAG: sodium/substrate symporter small subunit [Rubrimonas sp.]